MKTQMKESLLEIACHLRKMILRGVYAVQSGHPGGSLSSADILTWLLWREMKIDPNNPK